MSVEDSITPEDKDTPPAASQQTPLQTPEQAPLQTPQPIKESFFIARWLFLRMLGLIYLIAFLSVAVQVQGLIGSQGILPAHVLLENARLSLGNNAFWQMPTLAWISCSDSALQLIPVAGAIVSLLVICGVLTAPCLFVCWLLYLSLMSISGDFLMFQWDSLLLETGFLSFFVAPWQLVEAPLRRSGTYAPPFIIIFLMRLLLFRLLFGSGLCKIVSGDPTWRDLTALTYHYETQPLPTPLAWWVNQLPVWFQKFSCGCIFFQELVIPPLVFAPRSIRMIGGAFMISLQLLIAATGNYAFFNLLTLALILFLFDDRFFEQLLPTTLVAHLKGDAIVVKRQRLQQAAASGCLALIVAIVASHSLPVLTGVEFVSDASSRFIETIQPFEIFNSYGLFAVMTTSRPEIVIEGSNDGNIWQAYEFKYKPGDLNRPPPIVAPYQPRLDWQMWFASLSDYQSNPWFVNFIRRLLEGSQPVLALLEKNPFPDKPPHYIRAMVYDYHFTGAQERQVTGAWWRRRTKGLYFPVATLGSN